MLPFCCPTHAHLYLLFDFGRKLPLLLLPRAAAAAAAAAVVVVVVVEGTSTVMSYFQCAVFAEPLSFSVPFVRISHLFRGPFCVSMKWV